MTWNLLIIRRSASFYIWSLRRESANDLSHTHVWLLDHPFRNRWVICRLSPRSLLHVSRLLRSMVHVSRLMGNVSHLDRLLLDVAGH